MVMFMYTIYYIFLVMIIISFITGLILNIVENKHKKDKNKEEVLESENTMTRKVNNYTLADDEKFSKTISFSRPIKYIFKTTGNGFYFICSTISKGFFYYFYAISSFISFISNSLKKLFKKLQTDPSASFAIIFIFILGIFTYTNVYTPNIKTVKVSVDNNTGKSINAPKKNIEENKKNNYIETNLFRIYGNTDINSINLDNLRKTNNQIVAWLIVDGTNVNYPIVKTDNNDYYLNHNINKSKDSNGWTFMDYRNNIDLSDNNTIFYGHNLINKTSFGSLSKVFTKKWFNNSNHNIVVVNDSGRHIYSIFSVYYSEPVTDYLQTNFYDSNNYMTFLSNLKSKSKFDFNIELNSNDKIITLSTCTDDNKGRKVVHAKLIS